MKAFLERIFSQKSEVNYLYFSCFLFFLSLLSLSHFFTWEHDFKGISIFFLFYAFGQALFEVFCFVLIGYLLDRWAPRFLYLLFVGISFLLMLLHFTNFLMIRVVDAPLPYIFKFLFGSGIIHLIASFQSLNLNWTMIGITFATFLLIPIAGIIFHKLTLWVVKKKPLNLSLKQIAIAISVVGVFLFTLDLISLPLLNRSIYSKYKKILPLGTTFLTPTLKLMTLLPPLPPCREEENILKLLPHSNIAHLPNIYLFVIETFRKDFLSVATHLSAFANENIQFNRSFANSNATHLSWFSIFHADLPLYWTSMRDTWKKGSVPLQMLKQLGYKVSVFSSSDLRFFQMDKLLFGSDLQLIDEIEEYSTDRSLKPFERDALAFQALQKNHQKSGHIYLVFLDSPHSEYSFPLEPPPKYQPISKEIDYLTINPKSPEIELVKNRYRNAIDYVDQLMGSFFDGLKKENLYDDAIIAITGDHGEEFFEEGALFHGTHLNDYQTAVPLLFKFPSKEWIPQTKEATHIDIFPSILHYLTKESDFTPLFDGRSIFNLDRLPFRMAFQQNGPDAPSEFLLEGLHGELRAQLETPNHLRIVELQGSIEPDIFSPLSKNL